MPIIPSAAPTSKVALLAIRREDQQLCARSSCSSWSRVSPHGCGCLSARRHGRPRRLDPPPSARRPAAAAAAPPDAALGRPRAHSGPARRDTKEAVPWIAAADYPGHDRALAPCLSPPPLGRQVPPGYPPEHQGPGPAAGSRESRLGVPKDPWRDGRTGSQSLSAIRVHGAIMGTRFCCTMPGGRH
jgi:hypothetical protein